VGESRPSANRGELGPVKLLIRDPDDHSERRTADRYSNAADRERLRQTAIWTATCPNDRERPRRQEFASRGTLQSVRPGSDLLGLRAVPSESKINSDLVRSYST
jgi:hypothetical protein